MGILCIFCICFLELNLLCFGLLLNALNLYFLCLKGLLILLLVFQQLLILVLLVFPLLFFLFPFVGKVLFLVVHLLYIHFQLVCLRFLLSVSCYSLLLYIIISLIVDVLFIYNLISIFFKKRSLIF